MRLSPCGRGGVPRTALCLIFGVGLALAGVANGQLTFGEVSLSGSSTVRADQVDAVTQAIGSNLGLLFGADPLGQLLLTSRSNTIVSAFALPPAAVGALTKLQTLASTPNLTFATDLRSAVGTAAPQFAPASVAFSEACSFVSQPVPQAPTPVPACTPVTAIALDLTSEKAFNAERDKGLLSSVLSLSSSNIEVVARKSVNHEGKYELRVTVTNCIPEKVIVDLSIALLSSASGSPLAAMEVIDVGFEGTTVVTTLTSRPSSGEGCNVGLWWIPLFILLIPLLTVLSCRAYRRGKYSGAEKIRKELEHQLQVVSGQQPPTHHQQPQQQQQPLQQ